MNSITRRTLLLFCGSISPVFGQQARRTSPETIAAAANRRLLRQGMPWFAARPEIEQAANAAARAQGTVKQGWPSPRATVAVYSPAEGDFSANVFDGATFTEEVAANAWTSGFPIGQFLPPGTALYGTPLADGDGYRFPTYLETPEGKRLEAFVGNYALPLSAAVGFGSYSQINFISPPFSGDVEVEFRFDGQRAFGSYTLLRQAQQVFLVNGMSAGYRADGALVSRENGAIRTGVGVENLGRYFSFFFQGEDFDRVPAADKPGYGITNPNRSVPVDYDGVLIDGQPVPADHVLYYGLAPELASLFQGNLLLPAGIGAGLHELQLRRADGSLSKAAAIPVTETGSWFYFDLSSPMNAAALESAVREDFLSGMPADVKDVVVRNGGVEYPVSSSLHVAMGDNAGGEIDVEPGEGYIGILPRQAPAIITGGTKLDDIALVPAMKHPGASYNPGMSYRLDHPELSTVSTRGIEDQAWTEVPESEHIETLGERIVWAYGALLKNFGGMFNFKMAKLPMPVYISNLQEAPAGFFDALRERFDEVNGVGARDWGMTNGYFQLFETPGPDGIGFTLNFVNQIDSANSLIGSYSTKEADFDNHLVRRGEARIKKGMSNTLTSATVMHEIGFHGMHVFGGHLRGDTIGHRTVSATRRPTFNAFDHAYLAFRESFPAGHDFAGSDFLGDGGAFLSTLGRLKPQELQAQREVRREPRIVTAEEMPDHPLFQPCYCGGH